MPKAHHLSDPLPSSSSWPASRPRPNTTTTRTQPSIPAALFHHDPSSLPPPGVPVMSVAWAVSVSLAAAQRPRHPPPPPARLDGAAIVSPTSSLLVRPRLLGASAGAAPTTAASRANLRNQLLAVVSEVLDLVDVDDIGDVEGNHRDSSFPTRTMSSSTETRGMDVDVVSSHDEKQSLDLSGHSESHPPKQ